MSATVFEVGTLYRIIDQATPALRQLSREVSSLQKIVSAAQKDLSALGRIRLTGLATRVDVLTRSAGQMGTAFGSTFKAMNTGTTAAIADVGALATEWRAVAAAATAAGRATTVATRANTAAAATGGAAARRGFGAHVGSIGAPIPGGHVNFGGGSNVVMGALAAGAYGIYKEAELEDAAMRTLYTAGVPMDNIRANASYQKLRKILQDASVQTGAPLHDLEEAAHTAMRQFAGMPVESRLSVLPTLLEASAAEARLKGHGTTVNEGMETFTGFAHMLKSYSPDLIAKLANPIAYLSATSPLKLKQIEGAAGYALPILQGSQYDPMEVLIAGTAMQRSGIYNTKSGTWLRELGARAMPGALDLMSEKERTKRLAAGQELGLLDKQGKPTFFENGKPSFLKVIEIAAEHAAKIPVERRAGVERAYFGTQGTGALEVLGDPAVQGQIKALKKEMLEFKTGYEFFEKYTKESPIQAARVAFADLEKVLMDIAKDALPPLTGALRIFHDVMSNPRYEADPFGAAVTDMRKKLPWWLGGTTEETPAGVKGDKSSWNVIPPAGGTQTIQVNSTINLDRRKIGEAVTEHMVTQSSMPTGGSIFFDPSHSPPAFDTVHP